MRGNLFNNHTVSWDRSGVALAAAVIAFAGIRCCWQVVASELVLTTHDFVYITNAIGIGVAIDNCARSICLTRAEVTAFSVCTAVVAVSRCGIVVARRVVLTTCNFINVTNTITVGVSDNYSTCSVSGT